MKFPNALKNPVMAAADSFMSLIPRSSPSPENLRRTHVVAHRGFWRSGTKENTLAAFRAALANRIWGIEFDVRWTSDGVPVVHHDPTARRVFHDESVIDRLDFQSCRRRLKDIPTLEEVVSEFGGRMHLMIEIKGSHAPGSACIESLASALKNLEPVRDYHLIGLKIETLLACRFAPRKVCLPIAEFNVRELSRASVEHGFGGITGQYILIGRGTIEKHHALSQKVGTGFISNRSTILREVNRGVDFLFTNEPVFVRDFLASYNASPDGM